MFASMLERARNLGVRLTEDEVVAHGGTMLLAGELYLWASHAPWPHAY